MHELGISDTSLHQWRKELAQHGKEAFLGSGHQIVLEEENRVASNANWSVTDLAKSGEHLLTGIQMKYQFIEQHKQEFPVVVMCHVLGIEGSAAITPSTSVPPADGSEKMLNSQKRFN